MDGLFQSRTQCDDPAGLLQGSGKYMRHVKLRTRTPVDEEAVMRLITAAYVDMKSRVGAG